MLELNVISSPAGSGMVAINPNLVMYITGSDKIKTVIPKGSIMKFTGEMLKEDKEVEVIDTTTGTITLHMMNGDKVTLKAEDFGEFERRAGFGHYKPDF